MWTSSPFKTLDNGSKGYRMGVLAVNEINMVENKESKESGEVKGQVDAFRPSHKNIFAAQSAFQGELKPIEKDGRVIFETSRGEKVDFKYTTLGKNMEVISPLLAKHGLSVRHFLNNEKGTIEAILTHETYGYEKVGDNVMEVDDEKNHEVRKSPVIREMNTISSGELPLDLKKADMKDVGAQITYGRRYTLGLVLGLATEEDKDVQLIEQSQKNVEKFALKTVRERLMATSGEELKKQIAFLAGELKTAQALEAGTGKKAPSLGLKAVEYEELIAFGNKKVADEEGNPA